MSSFFSSSYAMSLETITPTTELEAVNAILAAVNEAPIESLALAAGRADVALAQDALAVALRETMEQRWRFNSDINYQLNGTAQGGAFVYPEPAGLQSFTVTPIEAQAGLDIVARPSRTYLPGGNVVRILANRIGGGDTLALSTLRINPTWAVPFSLCPEPARRYIVRAAVRRRVQQSGIEKQVEAAVADEQAALASLTATEGYERAAYRGESFGNETDALNTVLQSAGRAGVPDVLAAEGESLSALAMLRQAVVDVCSQGWRFNTEIGVGIAPLGSVFYNWPDVDGTVTPVLIYPAAADMLTATPAVCQEQYGSKAIDITLRTAKLYTDVGGSKPRVVYDRANHRDGFPAADRTVLWLDVTYRRAFNDMPEEARKYATIIAARRFAPTVKADPRWTAVDEQQARVTLQRAEGKNEQRNIFRDNPSIRAFRGRQGTRNWRS